MDRVRVRAAWMYYVEQMTQNDIAAKLNIGRVTVVRLLAEARARGEVQISVSGPIAEITRLERELEARFALDQAIVAPLSDPSVDPTPAISAAIGSYLSEAVTSGATVGLGWGRTLLGSLPHIQSRGVDDLKVVSLLGGITQAHRFNPAEFVWRFAQIFQGDAYLLAAPAIVDSEDTKHALIERCGLEPVIAMSAALDLLVFSVGDIDSASNTYRSGYIAEAERRNLVAAGAVGDVLFHFFDDRGEFVDHPINNLVIAAPLANIKTAATRVLASGGPNKIRALLAVMRIVPPTVFITDEETARAMLRAG
ncbi:sugar-binding transcriptional regulator [Jiella sp. CQZ9-1]|uniref:Sugar-binding transcriptional regulator n=2 Tax=Jiella flava TaxID=2816857 RepID=A0A939FY65_9HYPH|nr:sugar-binding transcriptional regulator [Jiella flava]